MEKSASLTLVMTWTELSLVMNWVVIVIDWTCVAFVLDVYSEVSWCNAEANWSLGSEAKKCESCMNMFTVTESLTCFFSSCCFCFSHGHVTCCCFLTYGINQPVCLAVASIIAQWMGSQHCDLLQLTVCRCIRHWPVSTVSSCCTHHWPVSLTIVTSLNCL